MNYLYIYNIIDVCGNDNSGAECSYVCRHNENTDNSKLPCDDECRGVTGGSGNDGNIPENSLLGYITNYTRIYTMFSGIYRYVMHWSCSNSGKFLKMARDLGVLKWAVNSQLS